MPNGKSMILILLAVSLLSSCGVYINSVVDKNIEATPRKLLVIIPTYGYFKNFGFKFKTEFENYIINTENQTTVYLYNPKVSGKLELNSTPKDTELDSMVFKTDYDVLIVIKPTHVTLMNGAPQLVDFLVRGIDKIKKTEIWKAEMNLQSQFGLKAEAGEFAHMLYSQLLKDKVLKPKADLVLPKK